VSPQVVAAVDCGSNSTRLLVSRVGPDGQQERLARLNRITRLGQRVGASGVLATEAVERTIAVLREYKGVIDDLGAERVRMIATSATRDAADRDDFFSAAEELMGVAPELLSGEEEGRLEFRGAASELEPAEGPFLIVDIGGGSTEFVVGTEAPEGIVSVDQGCVRLSEQYLGADPPSAEELSQAISVVQSHLEDVARELPAAREARRLVGLAGTVTTMAAVEIGVPDHDPERTHHFVLTRKAAEDVFRTLATEPLDQRVHNPGLEEARADVIVGGAAILVTVMRHFDFDECLVSEADILDGLVLSLLE
jgi:exopolyphosphatase/guanosine-5'-triphosphate,3'-diphosphate pyrophosphatase